MASPVTQRALHQGGHLQHGKISWKMGNGDEVLPDSICSSLSSCQMVNTKWPARKSSPFGKFYDLN